MTTNLPAPKSVIELNVCKCKTGCKTNRCLCLKNDMKCSDMCLCINCENGEDDNIDQENIKEQNQL